MATALARMLEEDYGLETLIPRAEEPRRHVGRVRPPLWPAPLEGALYHKGAAAAT